MCWILNRGPSQEFPKNQLKGFVWSRCKPNRKVPRLQTRRNFERRERGKWNRSRWRPKTWKNPFFFNGCLVKKKHFLFVKILESSHWNNSRKSRCCKFKGLQMWCMQLHCVVSQQVAGAKAKSQELSGDERCNLITWYLAPEISTN